MSTNIEQEPPMVESPPTGSTETENASSASPITDDNSTATATAAADVNQAPAVEEQKSSSSWFSNLGLSPNLTNQLTNLSSSFMQVTSKVSAAANTLVQKTLPQRPTTPNENEQTEETKKTEEGQQNEQTTEDNTEAAGANKDLTSTCLLFRVIHCDHSLYLFRYFY
jgi:hypothetical protein